MHRDIKPSNILLTDDRKIKLLDLGLGVLMEADSAATFATADGIAVGTVDYMSPEQACGREVDGRSDLYGLGCSMYHLMTAKLPFPGSSPIERLGKRISGRHVPITDFLPNLPPNFVKVIDRLLAHKPHERYPTAADAADALERLLRPKARPVPVAAPAPPVPALVVADAKQASEAKAQPVVSGGPMLVKVRPTYPRWFEPAARLAEQRPRAALVSLVLGLAILFAAGLVLGLLIRLATG